ncbi:spermatogenesis-defective protein 39 homolog isoform X2 [Ptychodera flava]|uniref:spermatogenesis-defective protein 39 homolog isoform X2 n=1 Tax=Ptychodera flava TaxID=63121 RepID=UPI003969F775
MASRSWRRSNEDDDDYWGMTSKKSLTNPFDFDDDVTDFDDNEVSGWLTVSRQQQASELSKTMKEVAKNFEPDDSDSIDLISWDGTKTGEIKSARYRPNDNSTSWQAVSTNSQKSSPTPSAFSGSTSTYPSAGHSRTSSQGNNRYGVSVTSEPSSISEAVSAAVVPKKPPTATEVSKLESQVKMLQRSLESARSDRWSVLSPEMTIKRVIAGDPYSLELYKSLSDKLALLDEAVKSHDGNAIIAVILFLKNSLKKTLFIKELNKRPDAVNQYLHYMKGHYELIEMGEFLRNIGRIEEAAMLKYKQALGFNQAEDKLRNLQNCLRGQFKDNWSLSESTEYVEDHCALLERQIAIEKNDSRDAKDAQFGVFKTTPRVAQLPSMPAITTLFYCCIYHYDKPENSISSPFSIRRDFKLSENQFLYTALTARAKLNEWRDIETLLTGKGWFGTKKMKASIGFEKVIDILNKMNAPKEILDKYLQHIDDTDQRLSIAMKLQCPKTVIDTLVQLKDRQQLLKYEKRLPPRSAEAIRIETIMRNSNMKWKN